MADASALAAGNPVALFLFAHQDDEFGVFGELARCRAAGQRVMCAYFTRGAGSLAARRNAESTAVLARLGVPAGDIVFPGDLLGVDDGTIADRLDVIAPWLERWLDGFAHIGRIYIGAWEGGHHDHDALHALVLCCTAERGLLDRTFQFSLYNGVGLAGPLFRVLSPLPANGSAVRYVLGWGERLRYLRLCLCYPSQRNTWLALFPFVLWRYLVDGVQSLQAVSLARLDRRPHEGSLYYERRFAVSWESMQARIATWRRGR